MNRPLKTAGIGAVALLLASTAVNAAVVTPSSVTGGTLPLDGQFVIDAPAPPAGQVLQAVTWSLSVAGTWDIELFNNSTSDRTLNVANLGAELIVTSCCPPSFAAETNDDGTVDTTVAGSYLVAGNGGTAQIPLTDFFFSQGGTITDAASLAEWSSAPLRQLSFEVFTGLTPGGFFPNGTGFTDSTEATVTLTVDYRFGTEPTTVIPLPAAGWLLLTGIFGLGGLGWMRRRAA